MPTKIESNNTDNLLLQLDLVSSSSQKEKKAVISKSRITYTDRLCIEEATRSVVLCIQNIEDDKT